MRSYFEHTESGIITNSEISRNTIGRFGEISSYYTDNFDAKTVWYDAIQYNDHVQLICPKLRNFEGEIRQGKFLINDEKVKKVEIKKYKRTDIISIKFTEPIHNIKFISPKININSKVNQCNFSIAKNKNCAMILNKDNDLNWLSFFSKWHVKYHKLECLFILDNGSTKYSNFDVEKALQNSGLESLFIVNLPFHFGPARLGKKIKNKELFLQTSAYNILRLRFLRNARAVLCCDIDELVRPQDINIYDYTVNSKMGFIKFLGESRYHNFNLEKELSHKSSFYKMDNKNCRPKWCINPQGKLKNYIWSTHSLENLFLDKFYITQKYSFIHCVNVTTGWKGSREENSDNPFVDLSTKTLLQSIK